MITNIIVFVIGLFIGAYLWKPGFKEKVSDWLKKKKPEDKNKEQ